MHAEFSFRYWSDEKIDLLHIRVRREKLHHVAPAHPRKVFRSLVRFPISQFISFIGGKLLATVVHLLYGGHPMTVVWGDVYILAGGSAGRTLVRIR